MQHRNLWPRMDPCTSGGEGSVAGVSSQQHQHQNQQHQQQQSVQLCGWPVGGRKGSRLSQQSSHFCAWRVCQKPTPTSAKRWQSAAIKRMDGVQLQPAESRHLSWQMHMSSKFPIISAVAGRVLSAHMTSYAPERNWLMFGNIFSLAEDQEPAGAGAHQEDSVH